MNQRDDVASGGKTAELALGNPRRLVAGALRVGFGLGIVLLLDSIWTSAESLDPRRAVTSGDSWGIVHANLEVIQNQLDKGLSVTKVREQLEAQGVTIPHRTLHLYARCYRKVPLRSSTKRFTAPALALVDASVTNLADNATVGCPAAVGARR